MTALLHDIKDCLSAALNAAVSRWRFLRDMRRGNRPDETPYF